MATPDPTAFPRAALLLLAALTFAAPSSHAALYELAVRGTISTNTSGDETIAIGAPFAFELVYDTAAPDLDFELSGSPDPTVGLFTNTGATPALVSFHYRASDYEVTIDDPADFSAFSEMIVTFTSVHSIDVNIHASASFPTLAGGEVSFHADFNDLSERAIFESDALPTDPALDLGSFDQSTVSLLPPSGDVSSSTLTSFAITPVPEPASSALAIASLVALLGTRSRRALRARRGPARCGFRPGRIGSPRCLAGGRRHPSVSRLTRGGRASVRCGRGCGA